MKGYFRNKWGVILVCVGLELSLAFQVEAFEIPSSEKKTVLQGRDIFTKARLDYPKYGVQNAMVVHASLERTRRILTRFEIFGNLVPYIERSQYDTKTRRLDLAGGIWKYRLESILQFHQHSTNRWSFEVIQGHFFGMTGLMEFESLAPGLTLVKMSAEITAPPGAKFPPRFVIEQGAQIIFAVTGRRVRSLVEDMQFEPPQDVVNPAEEALKSGRRNESEQSTVNPSSSEVPQPRRGSQRFRR